MKKVLVLLLMCLSGTVMFAQTLHWSPVIDEGTPMTLSGVLVIDGEEIGAEALSLEIGFFDQNGVCRGAKLPKKKNNRYKYSPNIQGKDGVTTTYTCKVWDHNTNQERTDLTFVVNAEDPLVWQAGHQYGTSSQPYLLTFVSSGTEATYEKDITGYGEDEGHWYLISSPVGDIDVTEVGNLTEGTFDLYYYDQYYPTEEWRNYEQMVEEELVAGFTQLEAGKGYLYANQVDVTLTFPHDSYIYDGDGTVNLEYYEDYAWAGQDYNYYWNLVGNPYPYTATIDRSEYYVMNESGTALEIADRENNEVYPIEGVIVMATGAGETVTFTSMGGESAGGGDEFKLNLKVSDGRGHSDLARVRFGQGHDFAKYMLGSDNTKLCFPKGGAEYAVVYAGEMGEMPVSFKAGENGTYTMVFSSNVSFNYLHLVDNMTGADVDVLANPSYTFEASTTDYASRFKLVFATGSSEGDSFAFYSNGNFIVSNEGEAVLQVVDVMGRILSSETIEGSASINVDAAHGVYMLRLINGNDVKVQKVVVE